MQKPLGPGGRRPFGVVIFGRVILATVIFATVAACSPASSPADTAPTQQTIDAAVDPELATLLGAGREIYYGRGQCAVCHGDDGAGGSGPSVADGAVLVTFPDGWCDEHIRLVALGTTAWPDETYGANNTPVGAWGTAMPGMDPLLTEAEIAAVVVFDRVNFGGQDLAAAAADCEVVDATPAPAG